MSINHNEKYLRQIVYLRNVRGACRAAMKAMERHAACNYAKELSWLKQTLSSAFRS